MNIEQQLRSCIADIRRRYGDRYPRHNPEWISLRHWLHGDVLHGVVWIGEVERVMYAAVGKPRK